MLMSVFFQMNKEQHCQSERYGDEIEEQFFTESSDFMGSATISKVSNIFMQ